MSQHYPLARVSSLTLTSGLYRRQAKLPGPYVDEAGAPQRVTPHQAFPYDPLWVSVLIGKRLIILSLLFRKVGEERTPYEYYKGSTLVCQAEYRNRTDDI